MTASVLVVGSRFSDRYVVARLIKAGGMGAVYEVLDERSNRHRAMKVLLPNLLGDRDMRARFEREAKVTGQVDSEHLVEVFDAGVDPTTSCPFIVMELLRGRDLDALSHERGALPPAEVITLLRQAASALDKTHAAAIVHRDLKPENLFLTLRDDGTPRVRVLDFGIAKVLASGSAVSTRTMGTPMYMAPEQALGRADLGQPVDIYALGHIAYSLLVGASYWQEEAKTMEVIPFLLLAAQGAREPASVRAARKGVHLPEGFDAWFAKATSPEPTSRFKSAGELVHALGDVYGAAQPAAVAAVSAQRSGTIPLPLALGAPSTGSSMAALAASAPVALPRKSRGPALFGMAIALVLGVGGVGYWGMGRTGDARATASSGTGPVAPAAELTTSALVVAAATAAPSVTVSPSASVANPSTSASASSASSLAASPTMASTRGKVARPAQPATTSTAKPAASPPTAAPTQKPRMEGLL